MTRLGNGRQRAGHRLTTALVALVAGGLPLALATPAHAEGYSFRDRSGDAVLIDEAGVGTTASDQAAGDVVGVAMAHTNTEIAVRVRLRARMPATDWTLRVQIKTPRGPYAANLGRSGRSGGLVLTRGPQDAPQRCAGLRSRYLDATHQVIRVVVPRTCLQRPSAVRVAVAAVVVPSEGRFFADDALLRDFVDPDRDLVYSPRLYRG
ncbi:hypothetical protein [Nocardioides sp.]|uniref:hypothetical protein n=1 Tax=Nocardioides sp. TaxID=35761 RepID=UPI0035133555